MEPEKSSSVSDHFHFSRFLALFGFVFRTSALSLAIPLAGFSIVLFLICFFGFGAAQDSASEWVQNYLASKSSVLNTADENAPIPEKIGNLLQNSGVSVADDSDNSRLNTAGSDTHNPIQDKNSKSVLQPVDDETANNASADLSDADADAVSDDGANNHSNSNASNNTSNPSQTIHHSNAVQRDTGDIDNPAFLAYFVATILGIFLMSGIMSLIVKLLESRAFIDYNSRQTAWTLMMQPVSKLEQYLVRFLIYVIIVPVSYILISAGIILLCVYGLYENTLNNPEFIRIMNEISAMGFDMFKMQILIQLEGLQLFNIIGLTAVSFLAVSSLFFAGSAWFKSYPFIKTCIAYIIIAGLNKIFVPIYLLIPDMDDRQTLADTLNNAFYGPWMNMVLAAEIGIVLMIAAVGWLGFRRRSLP